MNDKCLLCVFRADFYRDDGFAEIPSQLLVLRRGWDGESGPRKDNVPVEGSGFLALDGWHFGGDVG